MTGLISYFGSNLFSAFDVGSWKPEPGVFLHAAKTMGFEPGQCVVVEDSPVGVSAVINAGMKPVLAGMKPGLYDPEGIHVSVEGVLRIRHMSELQSVIA